MRVKKAVILAGGKSSRMGKDKSLLPFGGFETLAEYQYTRLKRVFDEVYISTKEQKFNFQAPLIIDKEDTFSPLVALDSILKILKSEIFVLGVDMPFVSDQTIYKLLNYYNPQKDAIVAKNDKIEPLCGIYTPNILKNIKELLSKDNHKLNYLLRISDTIVLDGFFEGEFINLNYPKDYEQARSKE